MPIYEYGCQNCKYTLDVLQKIADAPLTECPQCGQPSLKRLVSAPRFRLKGQGWYETDFKKDNQRNLHGEREASSSSDSASGEKSADKAGSAKEKSSESKPKEGKSATGKSSGKTGSTV